MTTNPIRTLQVAAEHFSLLAYLAEHGESVSLFDLRSLHQKHKPDDARTSERLAEMFEELGLFEKSADSDLAWEVPHIVGEFLRHLTMRQRLAAPGQLAPIIQELASLTEDLRQAVAGSDLDRIRVVSGNIKQALDAARGLSRQNYRAILNEVMRIKSRQDKRTLRERFLIITQIQERHLEPLGGLVDVGGEMERKAAELIAVARYALQTMPNDPFVPELSTKIIASVRRMKDEIWTDFHSALREVTPLFRQIRRDHVLATAVSALLDGVGRQGVKALEDVAQRLRIARWRADNLYSGYGIEDYLVGVTAHVERPPQAPVLTNAPSGTDTRVLDAEVVAERLANEGEKPDLLKWLFESYHDYSDQQILQGMMGLTNNPDFVAEPEEGRATLETSDARYSYHPLRISRHA